MVVDPLNVAYAEFLEKTKDKTNSALRAQLFDDYGSQYGRIAEIYTVGKDIQLICSRTGLVAELPAGIQIVICGAVFPTGYKTGCMKD